MAAFPVKSLTNPDESHGHIDTTDQKQSRMSRLAFGFQSTLATPLQSRLTPIRGCTCRTNLFFADADSLLHFANFSPLQWGPSTSNAPIA
jgi:hypothetical protein